MRVAVSGVHGIGKTTIVDYLSNSFELLKLEEQARFLLDNEFPFQDVNRDLSVFMDFQNEVLERQIWLLNKNKDNPYFVTDRTPIDSLAYVIERLGAERYSYSFFYEKYLKKVIDIMDKTHFDIVYYLSFCVDHKVFWKSKEDNQRNLSCMYLLSLDRIMRDLYFYEFKYKFPSPSIIYTDDLDLRKSIVRKRYEKDSLCNS